MSAKRLLMTALVTVAILTASAFAQKNELTGIIGRTFVSDQGVKGSNLFNNDVHFGKGLTFEVNYGRHIWGEGFTRVTFEVPAVFKPRPGPQFREHSSQQLLLLFCDAIVARERSCDHRDLSLAQPGGRRRPFQPG
jgi:hypothetical protein